MSSRRFWVRVEGDGVSGPFRPVELRAMVSLGRIARTDELRDGEAGKWYPATRVRNLFDRGILREEAENQLRRSVAKAGTALPPVRAGAAPAEAERRRPAPARRARANGTPAPATRARSVLTDEMPVAGAEEFSGIDLRPFDADPDVAADDDARPRDEEDLPSAVIGTDDDFLNALDVPEAKTGARSRKAATGAARDASVDAANALLDSLRVRREAEFEGDELEGDELEGDDEELADGPLPPARRRKKRRPAAEPEPSGPSLNQLVLLTILAVPALAFGLHTVFAARQTTESEWRVAFDDLDALMNEFVDAARAPDPQWVAWQRRFEEQKPELRALTEAAPDDSAGGDIDRAVNTLEQAVRARADGATPEFMDNTVERAVRDAQRAAVKLGYTQREWVR